MGLGVHSSMACTDKMDLHRLTAANTKCSNESVDFVEHDVLPMAVRIDFQKKNRQKFNWINTILKLIIIFFYCFCSTDGEIVQEDRSWNYKINRR